MEEKKEYPIKNIIKRDGKIVPFDKEKIKNAIKKAALSVNEDSEKISNKATERVLEVLKERFLPPRIPQVEEIQDIVEEVLINLNYPKVAKSYIIYRHERKKEREKKKYKKIENKITHIIKRDGKIVPFDETKIYMAIHKAAASVNIHDKKLVEELTNEVVWYLNESFKEKEQNPSVEEIQDIVEEVLIKNKQPQIAKSYILYREERAKAREGKTKKQRTQYGDVIPYKKLWEVLNWNIEHECETIEKLNNHIRKGTIKQLILDAEDFYENDVKKASELIINRKKEIKLVIIAGPSSSGKTTTTIKLEEYLKKEGLKLVALNIDNYFFNLEDQPKDKFGDYDFETPEALDLNLINQHLKELLEGKQINVPKFNFKTGKREKETIPLKIEKDEIILIDTLHGLYEKMTQSVPDNVKFKLYIETLAQIKDRNNKFVRWTDIRLLRRMVRDSRQRSYDPKRTIEHWHYVRRSELKHIIPYIPTVDYIINGSLCYELAVLKKYLFPYFSEFIKIYQNDPIHHDAYIRSKRIFELFNSLEVINNDDELVPSNSVLREFIGGSCYTYHV